MSIRRVLLMIFVVLAVGGTMAIGAPGLGGESDPETQDSRLTTPLRSTMDRTFVESPNYHKGLEAPPGYAEKVAELKRLYGDDVLDPSKEGPSDNVLAANRVGNTSSSGIVFASGDCNPVCVERRAFEWDTDEPDVETIFGFMYPNNATNTNNLSFTAYFEREIDLEPTVDTIEFIVEPYDNGTETHLWIAIFDEGNWITGNPSSCPVQNIDVVQTSETVYEYYLNIRSDGFYDIGIKNTSNNQWQWIECDDSDDPGEYVGTYHASSELFSDNVSQSFSVSADFRDDWAWVADDDARRPRTVFDVGTFKTGPHTVVTYSYDSSNRTTTEQSGSDAH